MQIAVIGWGSLIWCPGLLLIRTKWRPDGPLLPLEFARISRDGRLTLVIHPGSLDACTYWALSAAETLPEARKNLRVREACSLQDIHSVAVQPQADNALSEIEARVNKWLLTRDGVEAAIWTGLTCNWKDKRDRSFTTEDAVRYLQELEDAKNSSAVILDHAREYVKNAPSQIQTRVRKAMQRVSGWEDTVLAPVLFEEKADDAKM